jgi:hypothetical protein
VDVKSVFEGEQSVFITKIDEGGNTSTSGQSMQRDSNREIGMGADRVAAFTALMRANWQEAGTLVHEDASLPTGRRNQYTVVLIVLLPYTCRYCWRGSTT